MIFDKKYNKTIHLLEILDSNFKNDLKKAIKSLPKELLNYCKNCYEIKFEENDTIYEISIHKDKFSKHNIIRLLKNNFKEKNGFLFIIKELNEEILNSNINSQIGSLIIQEKENSIEYDFNLKKLSENDYCFTTKKVINQNFDIQPIVQNYSHNDLINILKINTSKR